MSADQQVSKWGQIVATAWQDEKFKQRLLTEPAAVLKEFGFQVPSGVELRVAENTDQIVHLTLPAKPREGELSDEELEGVAGGTVALEYLLILPLIALASIVAVAPASDTPGSKPSSPTRLPK